MIQKTHLRLIIAFLAMVILPIYPAYSQVISSGDPPGFETGIRIQDSGGDIGSSLLEQYSAPCVVDWNADGNKDLLIGTFFGGNILLYLNEGTNNGSELHLSFHNTVNSFSFLWF